MDIGNSCAEDKNIRPSGEILVGLEKLGSTTTAPKVTEKKPEIKNDSPLKPAAKEDTGPEEEEDYETAEYLIKHGYGYMLDKYDFSIKYEPSKPFIPSDSSTSDSSTSDYSGSVCSETETVAEEAQTQKEKTLAGPEKIMEEEPEIKNETPLKPAAKEDTGPEEEEDYETAEYLIKHGYGYMLDKYDFSIKYEPSKPVIPFDSSTSDSSTSDSSTSDSSTSDSSTSDSSTSDSSTSDSSGSVCSETKTVAEEAQTQKEKTLTDPEKLDFRSSPELIADEPEIKNDTLLEEENAKTLAGPVLVKHGVKRLLEGGDKNSKQAKKMDDLNESERD